MERILIVGGAGYIGGYLTDVLRRHYTVTVYDNLTYETRFLKDVSFINGDVRDYTELRKALKNTDIVIWLAAIVGDGACAINPASTKVTNRDTVRHLTDMFSGKIIFASTCSVYGANDGMLNEGSPTNPLSLYASTKLEAESYVLENKNSLVFRLGTLFGMGDQHSRIRLDLVVNLLTFRACQQQVLSVNGGDQWRPLLHVKDVAHGIFFCLNHNLCGLYNLSAENLTIGDIARRIVTRVPAPVIYTDIPFEDRRNYKVSNRKMIDAGWEPELTLEYGIDEIYRICDDKRLKNPSDSVYSNAAFLREEGRSHGI